MALCPTCNQVMLSERPHVHPTYTTTRIDVQVQLAHLYALLDGGRCFSCRHEDSEHHTTAVPRWCGECSCQAYVPTSEDYHHALTVMRRVASVAKEANRA